MKKERNELIEWGKMIVLAAVFIIGVRTFIFSPIIVDGASMMPTYENGDRVIVNKIAKTADSFERFDIVVFEAPDGRNFIKRIIGLPGDHIAYKDDVLYINGEVFDEPYLAQYKAELKRFGDFTGDFTLEEMDNISHIPEGFYFVLGDNRLESSDSRDPRIGLISEEQMLGTAHIRLYPFRQMGWVK